jgi:hypothetical protein
VQKRLAASTSTGSRSAEAVGRPAQRTRTLEIPAHDTDGRGRLTFRLCWPGQDPLLLYARPASTGDSITTRLPLALYVRGASSGPVSFEIQAASRAQEKAPTVVMQLYRATLQGG